MKDIRLGLTFNDVLLVPKRTPLSSRSEAEVTSRFTKNIALNIPLVSANMATVTEHKMAIAMALNHSDVGVQVVCTKKFAGITGGNIAYYERVVRELERSRMTPIVPLVVLGIEPDKWMPDTYPPETDAPDANAERINEARKQRGVPPVVEGPQDEMSLAALRRLAGVA